MSEPMRILHVLGGLGLGGAESRIMDLYRKIEKDSIQFDFLIHTQEKGCFEDEIKELGGRVYRVSRFRGYNLFSYCQEVQNFFASHKEFYAVHGHMTSTASLYLPIAKKAGVLHTIAHARSAGTDPGIKGLVTRYLRKRLPYKADTCFACSTEAAFSVFGKESVEAGAVRILPNAIVTSDFHYQKEEREQLREKLGLTNRFVIGHVGRFHYAKNHEFLLRVFREIAEERSDATLLLLGEGPLMEEVRQQAKRLNLIDRVLFAGNRSNVAAYYMAMDYLIFPSRFEGLPGTVVEAQATGLHCLMSTNVTEEVMVTECVKRMSLEESVVSWAEEVLQDTDYERKDHAEVVKNAGFDAVQQAEWLKDYYLHFKPKLLLMVPMLHQGGFEKICVRTARLLKNQFEVSIVMFSGEEIAYDITGLHVIDLMLGSKPGVVGKLINVIRRVHKVRRIKKLFANQYTYSFGITANLVNVLSKCQDQVWVGIRGFTDLYSKSLPLFCMHSDLVICCSKTIEEIIQARFQECKSVTIYNPYDIAQIEALSKEALSKEMADKLGSKGVSSNSIILSMGREDEVKGFWHLIKSFYLVQQEKPDSCLVIVGEGNYLPYKKLVCDLGIEEKVHFTGVLKNPFPCLARASIYVLTSLNEGFPNALVEAMAMGVPVIATNCLSGPAEILGEEPKQYSKQDEIYYAEYGILVPILGEKPNFDANLIEREERILADQMLMLLTEQKLHQKYSEWGKKRAGQFSDEAYVNSFNKQ